MKKEGTFNVIDNDVKVTISIPDLLTTIWDGRWIILSITLLMMAFALAGSLFFAKYKSTGFFQFGGPIPMREKNKAKASEQLKEPDSNPGIALADYKRYAASYSTSERFIDFVKDKKLESTAGINDLHRVFTSRNGISRLIEPVYPFTKLDARQLKEQPRDNANRVIGLHIGYESKSPKIAQEMVDLLGRYAMDSIVYSIYSDELRSRRDETRDKIAEFDNAIASDMLLLEEYGQKAADLRKIIARNPGAAKESTRQVITISEETARYLPLMTQLMTTEVQVAETNRRILKTKREQKQKALLLEYYDRARSLLDGTKSGEALLRALEPVKETVFKGRDLRDNAVKGAYNMITADNLRALNLYLDQSRFIAGPTLPEQSTARPAFALAISLMLGLFLSILFVFGRKWLREIKTQAFA